MARPLIIDPAVVHRLITYAEENRTTLQMLMYIQSGGMPPPGDYAARSAKMPVGYRVVYTIEEHPQEGGKTKWFKHLSISCDNKMPSTHAGQAIMRAFGYGPIEDCIVYKEDGGGIIESINIIEEL